MQSEDWRHCARASPGGVGVSGCYKLGAYEDFWRGEGRGDERMSLQELGIVFVLELVSPSDSESFDYKLLKDPMGRGRL